MDAKYKMDTITVSDYFNPLFFIGNDLYSTIKKNMKNGESDLLKF